VSDDAVLTSSAGPSANDPPPEAGAEGAGEGAGGGARNSRLALALGGGAALIGALLVPVALTAGRDDARQAGATAASLAATLSGESAVVEVAASAAPSPPDGVAASSGVAVPTVWRVAQLSDDASVTLVDGVVGRRPLLAALGASGLPRVEAQRVVHALRDVRDVDHFAPKDGYTIARDKPTGRVVAFELSSSPTDVWQARETPQPDGAVRLDARKLELESTQVRVRKALIVGGDLRASFADAGFASDVLALVDDALDGHAELSDIRQGARLRIIATEERVDGVFVRYSSLDAVEYFPATPNAPPVRVYFFDAGDGRGKDDGWYDAKGRQPYHGGWRTPIPLARIASRFNPHRMHPVLHVVMPHNGVDFAAPIGAPVYATAAGEVTSVGNDGPCGNKVEIAHAGGITSVYCHLSRFASGLRPGQHVEARQLIAYVGQTGRVTGPHLHFGIKRGGLFIDPMTLRLDGVRVVPKAQRGAFETRRAELDAELDAIPVPAAGAGAPASGSAGAGAPASSFAGAGAPDVARPADSTDSESFYEEP
jgi:murein DD-endopeptidase MepM/ murein hydrolase activator NlpD